MRQHKPKEGEAMGRVTQRDSQPLAHASAVLGQLRELRALIYI